jgi:hypothetical protein
MFLMERHEKIPLPELSAFVQRCAEAGASVIIITRNADGVTYTVSLQRT